jgi:hypothetical protein
LGAVEACLPVGRDLLPITVRSKNIVKLAINHSRFFDFAQNDKIAYEKNIIHHRDNYFWITFWRGHSS